VGYEEGFYWLQHWHLMSVYYKCIRCKNHFVIHQCPNCEAKKGWFSDPLRAEHYFEDHRGRRKTYTGRRSTENLIRKNVSRKTGYEPIFYFSVHCKKCDTEFGEVQCDCGAIVSKKNLKNRYTGWNPFGKPQEIRLDVE